jgi:hypothetical protein
MKMGYGDEVKTITQDFKIPSKYLSESSYYEFFTSEKRGKIREYILEHLSKDSTVGKTPTLNYFYFYEYSINHVIEFRVDVLDFVYNLLLEVLNDMPDKIDLLRLISNSKINSPTDDYDFYEKMFDFAHKYGK